MAQSASLLFVLPVIVAVGVFLLIPTATVVVHSFTDWDPGYSSPWVGFDNFVELAESPVFHKILLNQGILLLGIPLWTFVPLALAVLLYDRVPAAGLFRTIFFFPATASPAIIGILFASMLDPTGPVNSGIKLFLPDSFARNWLVDPTFALPTIMVVLAWATTGAGVVIFSAALSSVSPELFEAATMDGAGWWARFRYVVLPALRSVIQLWVMILIITVFVSLFPWIFTLTRGGPGYATTTLDFDIYQNALSFGFFGTAAAETVYLLVLVGTLIAVSGNIFKGRRPLRRRG